MDAGQVQGGGCVPGTESELYGLRYRGDRG